MQTANILGPFGSGTNLVVKLLKNCYNINIKDGSTVIWKHQLESDKLYNSVKSNQDVIYIIMYRPFDSWINSMKVEDYHIMWNRKRVDYPAYFKGSIENKEQYFHNVVEIYELYYYNYLKLINDFDNVVWLNYNKVIEKDNCIQYFKEKFKNFDIDINKFNIDALDNPSKTQHGVSVDNYIEALEKIKRIEDENEFEQYKNDDIIDFFEKGGNKNSIDEKLKKYHENVVVMETIEDWANFLKTVTYEVFKSIRKPNNSLNYLYEICKKN